MFASFTISPDDIAKLAVGNPSDPLELALFAHDGKLAYRKGDDAAGMELYRKLVGVEDERKNRPAFRQGAPKAEFGAI